MSSNENSDNKINSTDDVEIYYCKYCKNKNKIGILYYPKYKLTALFKFRIIKQVEICTAIDAFIIDCPKCKEKKIIKKYNENKQHNIIRHYKKIKSDLKNIILTLKYIH